MTPDFVNKWQNNKLQHWCVLKHKDSTRSAPSLDLRYTSRRGKIGDKISHRAKQLYNVDLQNGRSVYCTVSYTRRTFCLKIELKRGYSLCSAADCSGAFKSDTSKCFSCLSFSSCFTPSFVSWEHWATLSQFRLASPLTTDPTAPSVTCLHRDRSRRRRLVKWREMWCRARGVTPVSAKHSSSRLVSFSAITCESQTRFTFMAEMEISLTHAIWPERDWQPNGLVDDERRCVRNLVAILTRTSHLESFVGDPVAAVEFQRRDGRPSAQVLHVSVVRLWTVTQINHLQMSQNLVWRRQGLEPTRRNHGARDDERHQAIGQVVNGNVREIGLVQFQGRHVRAAFQKIPQHGVRQGRFLPAHSSWQKKTSQLKRKLAAVCVGACVCVILVCARTQNCCSTFRNLWLETRIKHWSSHIVVEQPVPGSMYPRRRSVSRTSEKCARIRRHVRCRFSL